MINSLPPNKAQGISSPLTVPDSHAVAASQGEDGSGGACTGYPRSAGVEAQAEPLEGQPGLQPLGLHISSMSEQ
jgi:hypothetical protein